MEQVICQSCAMPMTEEAQFSANQDGSKNSDYCHYCFVDGHFYKEETMEDMIESCIPFVLQAGVYPDADAAREAMLYLFPTLKRWKKG